MDFGMVLALVLFGWTFVLPGCVLLVALKLSRAWPAVSADCDGRTRERDRDEGRAGRQGAQSTRRARSGVG